LLAAESVQLFPEMAERALAVLAEDDSNDVQLQAADSLRDLLARLDGLSRMQLVLDWALSDRRRLRAAMARALCTELPVLGVGPTLAELARDDYPEVRDAAAAAQLRRAVRARTADNLMGDAKE
jgi:hypothetical protein